MTTGEPERRLAWPAAVKMDDPAQQNRPKRLFINDVDKYSSGNIAKVVKHEANLSLTQPCS